MGIGICFGVYRKWGNFVKFAPNGNEKKLTCSKLEWEYVGVLIYSNSVFSSV